jgi:hypothetical protein
MANKVEKIKPVNPGTKHPVAKIKPPQKPVPKPATRPIKQQSAPTASDLLLKGGRSYGVGSGAVEDLMKSAADARQVE